MFGQLGGNRVRSPLDLGEGQPLAVEQQGLGVGSTRGSIVEDAPDEGLRP